MKDKRTYYKEFLLPSDEPFTAYTCNNENELGIFSQINLFVGPNSTGKSRLLRAIFASERLHYTTSEYDARVFKRIVKDIRNSFREVFPSDVVNYAGIGQKFLDNVLTNIPRFIDPQKPIYTTLHEKFEAMSKTDGQLTKQKTGISVSRDPNKIKMSLRQLGEEGLNEFLKFKFKKLGGEKRYYIPTLRGIKPLIGTNTNFVYSETIKNNHFVKNSKRILNESTMRIFTGQEMYEDLRKMFSGAPEQRRKVADYCDYLSTAFFNGEKIQLIPRVDTEVVHIGIGKEKEFPIYDVGDGLQTLIICTFTAFMEEDGCLFFIEEPDMFMHPGFQRAFLKAIQSQSQHQFFITTHSNHLLDMTIDFSGISVFRFRRISENENPRFKINNITSSDKNILKDLGVMNSSVFLTNATIWVEGISDRRYIRAYLRKYIAELEFTDQDTFERFSLLQEDTHYSFVEYQGSCLVHWTFDLADENVDRIKANYLCGEAILIADGDIAGKAKGNRVEFYRKCLDDRFILLPCKEIENLVPLEVIVDLLGEKFIEHGGDISSIKYSRYSKLKTHGLGRFLDNRLKLKISERVFSESSGTILEKQNFCSRAVKLMEKSSFEWKLPEELRSISDKLLTHIALMNGI